MPHSPSSKRPTCVTCLRPQSNCICTWVTPVNTRIEVLILQHPLEVNQTKGTARLLHLSLPNSRMVTGEVFDASLFNSPKRSIVLYPETPPNPSQRLAVPAVLDASWLATPDELRLVVLDGTWRKSRKILYLNPALQRMPRLPLRNMPASNYRIRTAHLPDQLSTLEATCAALAVLEGKSAQVAPLLTAFDGFVQQLELQQAGFKQNTDSNAFQNKHSSVG